MKKIKNNINTNITIIGKIIEKEIIILDELGNEINIDPKGWDHFK